jgi:hypothetical protein
MTGGYLFEIEERRRVKMLETCPDYDLPTVSRSGPSGCLIFARIGTLKLRVLLEDDRATNSADTCDVHNGSVTLCDIYIRKCSTDIHTHPHLPVSNM